MVVRGSLIVCGLLIGLTIAHAYALQKTTDSATPKSRTDGAAVRVQSPYQHQDTWYEFVLKQFNPSNVDYGDWLEQHRRNLIELRLKNPYFLYSLWTTIALILAAAICLTQRIDHRRAMSITAEMMADLYNQDMYSRAVAQEAIERYNKHIERCNRAIEGVEGSPVATNPREIEQLRTELMCIAEERDTAIRDRDVAREELRRKSEVLADMSVRLDAARSKADAAGAAKATSDPRGADARLVTHINNLQEQLYAERSSNRKLRGG
jgi:hypothetical protein